MGARLLLLVLMLILGSGCSVKFAYNNLDRFVRWGVSDYVDLTPEQRRLFDAEFAKLHDWHRRTQLPLYVDFLQGFPGTIADGTDSAELEAMEQQVRAWADAVVEKGLPLTADILRSLSDDQMAVLPERLEASNVEIADPEPPGDLESARAFWADELTDTFRRFAGRMTPAQRDYVALRSVEYIPERQLWADYRRRWQADLLALLAERDQRSRFDERFFTMARHRERYYGEELSAVFAHNEALSRDVARWLLNHLTVSQRLRLEERMLELAEDLRDLAGVARLGVQAGAGGQSEQAERGDQ